MLESSYTTTVVHAIPARGPLDLPSAARQPLLPKTFCHFTTAHSELKSRSFHRICLPLARNGVRITYISPAQGRSREGIEFISVPDRGSRLERSLFNWTLVRELINANAQIYHFQDPELLPIGIALKLVFRKCVIYDAYEDFPSMARASNAIPFPFRSVSGRLVEITERMAALWLDGLLTADPFTMRRLSRIGKSRKLVFANFPNLEFFPAPFPSSKKFDLVYRGGLSERTGTYDLLEAIRILKLWSRSCRLLLIGYFDDQSAELLLRSRIQDMGLDNEVEIRGRLNHEQMALTLSEARIGVCPLRDTAKFSLNLPVKVFEYWACGLPVIASDLPPIRPYFRPARAGLLFKPGDAAQLADSIEWLLARPSVAGMMGENGRAAVVERFNNQAEVRNLKRFISAIAGRPPARVARGG
jgi:glycosyltransferase involved in cell wall biosynthesis